MYYISAHHDVTVVTSKITDSLPLENAQHHFVIYSLFIIFPYTKIFWQVISIGFSPFAWMKSSSERTSDFVGIINLWHFYQVHHRNKDDSEGKAVGSSLQFVMLTLWIWFPPLYFIKEYYISYSHVLEIRMYIQF